MLKVVNARAFIIGVLLLGGCHLSLFGGGGTPGENGHQTQQSPLTPSSNPSDALRDKVKPILDAPSYLISAGMTGEPSVGDNGSASYRVPLWVPDGVNGLQPSLALEYNSEAGIGLLGPHWQLSGLSTITRCAKTRAQDGLAKPIDFFGDTFCLDGQRLVIVGSAGYEVEFRTERESYRKIVGTKDTAYGDFYKFRVYEREGRIIDYGSGYGSRLHGNPVAFPNNPQRDATYAFYADRIQDRWGNYISIGYQSAVFTASPDQNVTQAQELVPSQITWGPNQNRTASFEYDPQPFGWINPQMRWVHGLGIGRGQYVKSITMKGPDGVGGLPILRKYSFTYNAAPLTRTGEPMITKDPVLSIVSECDGNNVCKKPTLIQWESGSFSHSETPVDIQDVDSTAGHRYLAADLDRDGRDDLIYGGKVPSRQPGAPNCKGWIYRLTSHDPAADPPLPGAPIPLVGQAPDEDPSCLAYANPSTPPTGGSYAGDIFLEDLDGDGYVDILSPIGKAATSYANVMAGYRAYLNNKSASFSDPINFLDSLGQSPSLPSFDSPKEGLLAIGDIDGDGFPEVIRPIDKPAQHLVAAKIDPFSFWYKTENRSGYQFPYVECTASNCNRSVPDAQFSDGSQIQNLAAIDLDGDGIAEILRDAPSCPASTPCGSMTGIVNVTSPTMNGGLYFPPAAADPNYYGCGMGAENSYAWLRCPPGQVINAIDFAAYGTPNGNCTDGFSHSTCDAANVTAIVSSQCVGRSSCTVQAANSIFGDPCYGTVKRLYLHATCGGTPTLNNRRWMLDLNGDGLIDVAWLSSADSMLWTSMNTGQGFTSPRSTVLPIVTDAYTVDANGNPPTPYTLPLDGRTRIVDFDLDGRQDLWAPGVIEAINFQGPGTRIVGAMVLLSDGMGGFSFHDPGIVGSLGLDANGDGLPDAFLPGTKAPLVQLYVDPGMLPGTLYTRRGKAPEMVTMVREGNGRTISFSYDVSSGKDPSFYDVRSNETCDRFPKRFACLNRGRWLTRSLTISEPQEPQSTPTTQTFSYAGGVSDRGGRGFLGFTQRDIYGPGSQHTKITYDPITWANKTSAVATPYVYSLAMLPQSVSVDVNIPQVDRPHHLDTYTFHRPDPYSAWNSDGTLKRMDPDEVDHTWYDCATTDNATCTGTKRTLGSEVENFTRDAYGNLTKYSKGVYDGNGGEIQIDTVNTHYLAANTSAWLVSLLDPDQPRTTVSESVDGATISSTTRTVKYTPDTVHGGVLFAEFEPTGEAATHLFREFDRDSLGRLWQVSEMAMATGELRTRNFSYEPDGDGIYPTTITDPATAWGQVAHRVRLWRHPGLGLLVEVDDQDGLAATRTYDTFGRLLGETEKSGHSTTIQYQDSSSGSDMIIYPEGSTTRQTKIHIDSFGRERSRITPVDGSRVLGELRSYDAMGFMVVRDVRAGSATASIWALDTINANLLSHDDLGRPWGDCHIVSDGTGSCAMNTFDGLSVTRTDESNRSVTDTTDAAGRLVKQSVTLPSGVSDALFSYGPFGLMKSQSLSDNGDRTDFQYDVLGRRTLVTRTGAMSRRTGYNAFGDVVTTSKDWGDGTQFETLTYGRDELGRVTSIRGSGMNRTFYWDAPAPANYPAHAAPYAIGKLVDVFDDTTQVHFDYGPNGLPQSKSWTFSWLGQAPQTFGAASFFYDPQGRLDTLTYPTIAGSTAPLTVHYDYDPFTGKTSAIRDVANYGTPLWVATGVNERGEITGESMTVGGGPTITRSTGYSTYTGQMMNASLTGTGTARLDYTYQPDGLPGTFKMSGAGANWKATYDYDSLGRLTSWTPADGAPTVSYSYDSSGNLQLREWTGADSWEYVMYWSINSARSAIEETSTGWWAGNYGFDSWGRVNDLPGAKVFYNAKDEPIEVVEKGSQQDNLIVRDGFGDRVLTTYGGNPFLATLDDLYEYRYSPGGSEERCRLRADGKLVGELVRSAWYQPWSGTFYLEDNVGNVVAEAAPNGTVSTRAPRDPFGNLVADPMHPYLLSDPQGTNPDGSGRLGYGGHPREANWGVIDMKRRFYSPVLSSFLSPDPLAGGSFDRRDYNPFAYAWNSPTAMIDPNGEEGEKPTPPSNGGFGPQNPPGGGPGSITCPGGPGCNNLANPAESGHPTPVIVPRPGTTAYGAVPASSASMESANHDLRAPQTAGLLDQMGLGGPLKLRLGIGGSAAAFFGFTGFAGIEFNPNDLSSLVIVLQGGGTAGLGGSINFGYIGTGEVHEGVEFSVRGAVNVGPLQARLPLWSSTGSLTPKYRFGFKEEDQLSLGMKASMDGLTTIKVKPTTAAAGVETGANVVGTTVWQKVAGWLVGWGFPTFGL